MASVALVTGLVDFTFYCHIFVLQIDVLTLLCGLFHHTHVEQIFGIYILQSQEGILLRANALT